VKRELLLFTRDRLSGHGKFLARRWVVATLGERTGEDPEVEAGWEDRQSLMEGKTSARQMMLGEKGEAKAREAATGPESSERWESVDVKAVRVERVRDLGEAWLGLALWYCPGLQGLLGSLIEPGREGVPS
jgi:hypothetical protein